MAESTGTSDISSETFTTRMLYKTIRAKFPRVCQLSIEQLKEWLNNSEIADSILLLDVRETDERSVSFINNSIHILPSKTDLSNVLDRIKNGNKRKIIAYCSVGYRSSILAQKIYSQLKNTKDFNINDVEIFNLEGSIFKWANEGNDLVDGDGKLTKYVHPYNAVWGRFLDADRRKYPLNHNL